MEGYISCIVKLLSCSGKNMLPSTSMSRIMIDDDRAPGNIQMILCCVCLISLIKAPVTTIQPKASVDTGMWILLIQ